MNHIIRAVRSCKIVEQCISPIKAHSRSSCLNALIAEKPDGYTPVTLYVTYKWH